ncbi:uncharacterized protein LOC107484874 [Arachis duranensis]|uniref:Uncharacterized protein LOC107484874 n=1 Tax=Arachis duranensis TaxID=130453 RepID=A0A6P4D1K9_ARADU|nr:uncharacterized protein LOC107484874 [Arachis duranensis]
MRHREVYEWFVRKCNVNLNSTCITRALKATRKVVEGDEIAKYGLVWDYANELLTSNPGSTVQVAVIPMPEGPPQFEILYVYLDACKKGFKAGCRPMIRLDGTFLKTLQGDQILTACVQDANNHIFVFAYAIMDVENKDNWKWFLDLLQSDLGNYNDNKLCIISDMQKAWQYLEKWPKEAWTKAYFNEDPKNDNICNNACESFNTKIKHERTKPIFKHERTKPILTLAEEVRRIIMKSMVDNKLKLSTYQGILPPVQQSGLKVMTKLSSHWAPQWCGNDKEELFEVHGWPTNMVVDLEKHTCSCTF